MTDDCKVYVIDDDAAMRESLRFLLETHGLEIEVFGSAREFLDAGGAEQRGCLVVDVRMAGMTGLQLQEHLAERNSPLCLVVITGHADVAMAVNAMKAGAIDFIEKPFCDDALLDGINRAFEQGRRLSASKAEPDAHVCERLGSLTSREREVLEHLVTGNPHKVIAHDLDISPRTVEVHRAHIMQKLGARNFADLVRITISAYQAKTASS
jgi:two-component system, LuxR family, response regulator FixJ